mgnify:FL=1|jgi:hypothetical protein
MEHLRLDRAYQTPSANGSSIQSNYPSANSPQLSVIQEQGIVYTDTPHYITVNSSSRDASKYPLHYDYRINLNNDYRNIVKVSLVSVLFPNTANILDEPYLTIDLGELNFIDFESATTRHHGFCMLPLKASSKTIGGFINPELSVACQTSLELKTPIARLSSLAVKIRDYNGDIYNFGNAGGSTAKAEQHAFMLKITCRETSRKQMNNRIVL